ncbi:uncharacterized protein [Clytia hemisphaerica]|uniref:Ubiquitin-like domain-containing protein n=1 Tax=Clytia hemisphaerica TaxID=252671 RepID=A0A7M5UNE8_9CNID
MRKCKRRSFYRALNSGMVNGKVAVNKANFFQILYHTVSSMTKNKMDFDLDLKVIQNRNFKDATTIEVTILSGKVYSINIPERKNAVDNPLKVADVKALIAKQAKIPTQTQELFHEGISLKDDEVYKMEWKKLRLALNPTPEFVLLVYMYTFYRIKVRREWTIREVKAKLELQTGIPASSIYLSKEKENVKPLYAKLPADDVLLCTLNIDSTTKLVGLRMLHLGDKGHAPVMNKHDTVANLISRVRREKKLDMIEYGDKEKFGDLSKKDKLLELKAYTFNCI